MDLEKVLIQGKALVEALFAAREAANDHSIPTRRPRMRVSARMALERFRLTVGNGQAAHRRQDFADRI